MISSAQTPTQCSRDPGAFGRTAFVSTIEREMRAGSYQRLYLAGPDEACAEFERLLPPRLTRLIAGHLSASLDSAQLQHQLRDQLQPAAYP